MKTYPFTLWMLAPLWDMLNDINWIFVSIELFGDEILDPLYIGFDFEYARNHPKHCCVYLCKEYSIT